MIDLKSVLCCHIVVITKTNKRERSPYGERDKSDETVSQCLSSLASSSACIVFLHFCVVVVVVLVVLVVLVVVVVVVVVVVIAIE